MKPPHSPARVMSLTILVTIFAAAIVLPVPARAQTYDPSYPVCLQIYLSISDFYYECRYQTMGQCAASASGRSAQCIVNPYFAGPKTRRSRRQQQY